MTGPWGDPTPPENNQKPNAPRGDNRNSGGPRNFRNGPPLDPAEFEALIREQTERLRNMLPGSSLGGFSFGVLIIALLWLASGVYRVQEGQQGVVLRFGEVTRTAAPGLRYHLPYPIEEVLTPNVTFENRTEIGFRSNGRNDIDVPNESTMLTSDQNIIDLDFAVTWVIKDPQAYLFNIRDPDTTVKRAAESAMREAIGQTEIVSALTEARDSVQRETKKLLQQILDEYQSGVEIVRVELLRVNPPEPVVDAFNDVQRAEADRERLRNEAEAYTNKIIPEARGEAEKMKNEALGYKQQVVNNATGEANRFSKVWQAYEGAKDVTAQRLYLETMEEILSKTSKVVVDGKNGGVVPYMALPSAPVQQPKGDAQ